MDVIVVGGGTVGQAICSQLAKEKHNITVVDSDAGALNELAATLDIFPVEGNAVDVSVLKKAGAEKADLLVACANKDELNILCCAGAKKLGTKHTVARVRNPDYAEFIELMKNEINISLTINPEYAVANEIYRTLRFPSASRIDTFCRGRVEVAQFVVSESSPLCGSTLNDLRSKMNIKFLVCCILRDDEAIIPSGNFKIQEGDTVCVTAPEEQITDVFKALGAYKKPIKNILIVGGGRTTYYLAEMLKKTNISATVIEKDKSLCKELAENTGCTVICDNGTKQELLIGEGIDTKDALLALTNVDEENAIVSMFAKTRNVGKIITMISALPYIDFFKSVGIDSVVSPKSSITAHVIMYVRSMASSMGSEIESLQRILGDKVEALEFSVKSEIEGVTDMPLKSMKFRQNLLVVCIVRSGKVIIPSGNDEIRTGDRVVVITKTGAISSLCEIIKQ